MPYPKSPHSNPPVRVTAGSAPLPATSDTARPACAEPRRIRSSSQRLPSSCPTLATAALALATWLVSARFPATLAFVPCTRYISQVLIYYLAGHPLLMSCFFSWCICTTQTYSTCTRTCLAGTGSSVLFHGLTVLGHGLVHRRHPYRGGLRHRHHPNQHGAAPLSAPSTCTASTSGNFRVGVSPRSSTTLARLAPGNAHPRTVRSMAARPALH